MKMNKFAKIAIVSWVLFSGYMIYLCGRTTADRYYSQNVNWMWFRIQSFDFDIVTRQIVYVQRELSKLDPAVPDNVVQIHNMNKILAALHRKRFDLMNEYNARSRRISDELWVNQEVPRKLGD